MPNPQYQLTNAVGTAAPITLDWTQPVFNASFAVELQGSSTATFSVQFSLDDMTTTTPTWFYDANVGQNTTATFVGNYMFPVTAVRLVTSSLSAGGSIIFAVLQGIPV